MLLADLMENVRTYGRDDRYNFENVQRLMLLLSRGNGTKKGSDKKKHTFFINSFMRLWLLTLLKKLRKIQQALFAYGQMEIEENAVMAIGACPIFAILRGKDITCLFIHPSRKTAWKFSHTPSWNLMDIFKYYHEHKELWNTESIKFELIEVASHATEKSPEKIITCKNC